MAKSPGSFHAKGGVDQKSNEVPNPVRPIGATAFHRHPFTSAFRILALTAGLGALSLSAGCVPADGPLAKTIVAARDKGPAAAEQPALVFDIVEVDQRVATSLRPAPAASLSATFGTNQSPSPVIGVGDELEILIFESGPDGLFSTAQRKSTKLTTVVQPDGGAQVPFAGQLHLTGKTLEAARQEIMQSLRDRAVQPDIVVNFAKNESRLVSVQGSVHRPRMVTLGLTPEPLSSIIATAGGPRNSPSDTTVTLTRGRKSSTVRLQSILDQPREDITVRAGDKIFLSDEVRSFTALGAVSHRGKLPFQTEEVTVAEAAAHAGGLSSTRADPTGFFIFRYESADNYRSVVGAKRFDDLLKMGMTASDNGRYPIVYRLDLSKTENLLIGQNFYLDDKDVLYVSHHPATDFSKFVTLMQGPFDAARKLQLIANG